MKEFPSSPEAKAEGPLNYGVASSVPLRKTQVPQLNNSAPQEDPVDPDTAEVGQAMAWAREGAVKHITAFSMLEGAAGWQSLCLLSKTTHQ